MTYSNAQRPAAPREVLIAHRSDISPVTELRSTLLQSSIAALRAAGHFERYAASLPSAHRDQILSSLGPAWLPIELGIVHYTACESLGLDANECKANGERVGDRLQGTLLRVLIQQARATGVTPWSLFVHAGRLWERSFRGGSVSLRKVGPKDALVEARASVLCRIPYFRHALRGQFALSARLCGARAIVVKEEQWDELSDRFTMRASWV